MKENLLADYEKIRQGATGFYRQQRALIAVWGKEAVQFLNGMITNDVAKLEDGAEMLAAFPNAQGRLLAVVRVRRVAEHFLFETEPATHEKVFQNLFRFTYAGEFFVEDWTERCRGFIVCGPLAVSPAGDVREFGHALGKTVFVPAEEAEDFSARLLSGGAVEISDELFEVLRIEAGLPLFGVDMDETTIVPELGLDALISYNKGCYIGQEIIARIHFRGHVAKQLRGLVIGGDAADLADAELRSADDKPAGRVTSLVFSPTLGRTVALAFVRWDYLADGTELKLGAATATVRDLPLIGREA